MLITFQSDNASCYPKNYKTCSTGELIIETSKQLYLVGAFQIVFRVKMHVNNVFLFFKNYF